MTWPSACAGILRAVDPGRGTLAAQAGGAPPDEQGQLHLLRRALHERFRAVLFRGVNEQGAVAGADEELEVVKGVVVHRAVRYLLFPAGAISRVPAAVGDRLRRGGFAGVRLGRPAEAAVLEPVDVRARAARGIRTA